MPEDAYFMAGAGGQYAIIIPTHDLVVVRLGHEWYGLHFVDRSNRLRTLIRDFNFSTMIALLDKQVHAARADNSTGPLPYIW